MRIKHLMYNYALSFSVAWGLIIFILCATPGQYIPSANWLEMLSFDKFVHAFMFFVLSSLLFTVAYKYQKPRIVFLLFFFAAVCYGAFLELMQAYCFSNRSADWKDIIANTFGCVLALFLLKRIKAFVSS